MVEKKRDELQTLLVESEKQLESVRRQIIALEMRGSALESDTLFLQSDHAMLLKKREEELLSDMKAQLVKRSRGDEETGC